MHSRMKFSCTLNNFTHNQILRKIHTSNVRLISVSSKKWNQDDISQGKKISWKDKLKQWHEMFQVFVGLSDIKKAHETVTVLSRKAQGFASIRRELYEKLEDIHNQRYFDYQQMTNTDVNSEEYSKLQDKHYELKSQLRVLRTEFRTCERNEREIFEQLFISMKDCNRKEGYLAEQSKYWSIIASVISAILASFFTSLSHWMRFRELREMTEEIAHKKIKISSEDMDKIEAIVKETTEDVSEQIVDKEIKISSDDMNKIEAMIKEATEDVSEKIVDKEIKISSDDMNQIEIIVKEATEDVSEKMVDKEIKMSSDYMNQIETIVKEATGDVSENMVDKEIKMSSVDMNQIESIVKESTLEISEKMVDKEIKISSDNLNQIEAIIKEATEDVSEKIINKHYSSAFSKTIMDEKSKRALAVGVAVGTGIGGLFACIIFILMESGD